MKFLDEVQWQKLLVELAYNLKGSDIAAKANKGQLFEFLIEDLLKKLFDREDLAFTATKISHDGSKDFWGIDGQSKIWWAECKNYSENIAITQLAPTLFMAELYDVSHLLFFSYSPLNLNVKRKIGQYAAKHKKDIYLYDDEVLEQLLFTHMPELSKKYLPENYIFDELKHEVLYFYEKNPMFFNDSGFTGYYEIDELRMGEVYNLNVLFINKSLTHACEVNASVENNDDVFYFEFLSHHTMKASETKRSCFSVQPGQAFMETFIIRLIKCKKKLKLPIIQIEIKAGNASRQEKSKQDKRYECVSSVKDVFIGEHYEHIVNTVNDSCLNKSKITGFMVFGRSGTGKTRILDECYIKLLKHHYKVLNFTGFDINNDWKNVVREIIFNLYAVQDDIAFGLLCEATQAGSFPVLKDPEKATFLEFLRLLCEHELTLDKLRPYYKMIFEKLRKDRYALIVDNLQSYAPELVSFFNEMLQYYLNCTRPVHVSLMFSINTDLVFHEVFSSFLSTFIHLKNATMTCFCCEEIKGFQHSDQAIIFLKTILRMDDFPLNIPAIRSVLDKALLRPKYLEQIANYLMAYDAVRVENDCGFIPDQNLFLSVLENAPTDFQSLFEHNYRLILSKYPYLSEQAEKTLSLLYIFGHITPAHVRTFNLDTSVLQTFCRHGIIENKGNATFQRYVFEHDLYEICLSQIIYPNMLETAVQVILQEEAIDTFLDVRQGEYTLCLLVSDRIDLQGLRGIHLDILKSIPHKFQYGFYSHLLRNLIRFYVLMNETDFITYAAMCCKYVRDHINVKLASELFDTAFEYIQRFKLTDKEAVYEYHSFIVHMVESKIYAGEHDIARHLYHNYLRRIPSFTGAGITAEWLDYARAYIYNRIFVCGKLEGDKSKYLKQLEMSKELCRKHGFNDVMFENYFDEANLYLENNSQINTVVCCLSAGFEHYEKMNEERKEKFRVNYYSKKIMLSCLQKKFDDALSDVSSALSLIEYNDKINYHLFFKSRYLKFKIIILLMQKRVNKETVAALEDYEITLGLLGSRRSEEMLFFKAKYAYIVADKEAFLFYFKSIYKIITEMECQRENSVHALMLEDLAVKHQELTNAASIDMDLHSDSVNAERANRILSFQHKDFLHFSATYKTEAPLSDLTERDGYFP